MGQREDEADDHWSEFGDTHRIAPSRTPPPMTDTQRERVALERREAVRRALFEKPFNLLTEEALDTKSDAILAALDALPTQPTDEAVRGLVEAAREAEDFLSATFGPMLEYEEGGLASRWSDDDARDVWTKLNAARNQSAEIARLQALPLEGLVVPKHATAAMIKAGLGMAPIAANLTNSDLVIIWTFMLQAAPSAPLVGGFGSGSSPDGDTQSASVRSWVIGEKLSYDAGGGAFIRCTYAGDLEGWPLVTFDADGPEAVAVHVRPSRVVARRESGEVAMRRILNVSDIEPAPLSPSQPVIRAGDE